MWVLSPRRGEVADVAKLLDRPDGAGAEIVRLLDAQQAPGLAVGAAVGQGRLDLLRREPSRSPSIPSVVTPDSIAWLPNSER